jgi:predicted amidohydrolase
MGCFAIKNSNTPMRIALAQIRPVVGDIAHNLQLHLRLAQQAGQAGAELLVFPELSLTGYEPSLATALASTPNDAQWSDFQKIANLYNIKICVGMPLRVGANVAIGMGIFGPGQAPEAYYKQYLHSDETPFFVEVRQPKLLAETPCVVPAICYELSVEAHLEAALSSGVEVYLASVAKSDRGVEQAYKRLAGVAQRHGIYALMVNGVGPCDDFVGAGQTAIWDRSGRCIAQLDSQEEGLLWVEV